MCTPVLWTCFVYIYTVNWFCRPIYCRGISHWQTLQMKGMYRGQTLQVRRMYRYYTHKTSLLYRCLLNQFTVHVYTEYVQGCNLINNKWMEKLTFKRWKVNFNFGENRTTDTTHCSLLSCYLSQLKKKILSKISSQ